jgi:hypothetical protein
MLKSRAILILALLIGLLMPAPSSAEGVYWYDRATDPGGDVTDGAGAKIVSMSGLDIREITTEESNNDVWITMRMHEKRDIHATFNVNILVDDTQMFNFMWTALSEFTGSDSIGDSIEVTGFFNNDLTELRWVVPKTELGATESLFINTASVYIITPEDEYFYDTLDDRQPVGDYARRVEVEYKFQNPHELERTRRVYYEGQEAYALRRTMDANGDQTVDFSEVDAYVTSIQGAFPGASGTSLTMNGNQAVETSFTLHFGSATGSIYAPELIVQSTSLAVTFPDEEVKNYTLAWNQEFAEEVNFTYGNVDNASYILIKAPVDYRISRASLGNPITGFNDDDSEFMMNDTARVPGVAVVFLELKHSPKPKPRLGYAPGEILLVSVAAIVCATLVTRRSRARQPM